MVHIELKSSKKWYNYIYMKQPKNKKEDLIRLAKGGGNDASLLLYEKIDEVDNRVDLLEEEIKKDIPEDEMMMKMVTRIAKNLVDVQKGDKGEDSVVPGPKGEDSTVPGPKGDKGDKGDTVVGPPGPKGEDSIVPGPKGDDGSPDTAEQVRDKLESLVDDERLDISAIKGMDKTLADIRGSGKKISIAGGAGRGIQLYVGGVKKGLVQYANIVAGPNMTITDSVTNGLHTLTFTASGGSGFSQLSATETPNGTIKVFTFSAATAQPSFLVVDGVWMQATTASGTVNWTWASGPKQATLTIPANDDIYAVV